MPIDTADTVLHRPSGEQWSVAFVDDDRIYWCGWPEGSANFSDCELLKKATPAERHAALVDMSKSSGCRAAFAQRALEAM